MRHQQIRILFFIVVFIYLANKIYTQTPVIEYFLKPSIVGILIFMALHTYSRLGTLRWRFILALIFSLLGDIFLMIPGDQFIFFMAGLVCFLVAHIFYILVFSKDIVWANCLKSILVSSALIVSGYGAMMAGLLLPLLGDLKIPVFIYMVIIMVMIFISANRYQQVLERSYWLVLFGAILFVLSDSILAINKFYQPISHAGFLIMSTYSFAQLLIVEGVLTRDIALSTRA